MMIFSPCSIEMYIDDVLVGDTRLPPGAARVNSMRGEAGGLYIGGIPAGMDAGATAASVDNFEGCIRNLMANGE